MTGVLIRGRQREFGNRPRAVTTAAEIGESGHKPRDAWSHQGRREAGRTVPRSVWRERAPGDVLGLHDWPPARGTTQPCSSRATWSWASAAWAGNTDASRNVRQHGDGRRQLPASPRRPRRRGKSGAQDAPPVLRYAGY